MALMEFNHDNVLFFYLLGYNECFPNDAIVCFCAWASRDSINMGILGVEHVRVPQALSYIDKTKVECPYPIQR